MFRELLAIFKGGNPLAEITDDFLEMHSLARENAVEAGALYFDWLRAPERRTAIYKKDVKINKFERSIRRKVGAHLCLPGNEGNVPYCLVMMSLVKDVERMGDYAKNLAELVDLRQDPLPDHPLLDELREIRRDVEQNFTASSEVLKSGDREQAIELIHHGKNVSQRCDVLVGKCAQSGLPSDITTCIVLALRYYKRFGGHNLNILSSVVVPLHQIDFWDEETLGPKPKPE